MQLSHKVPRRFGALLTSGALVASFAGLALTTPAYAATAAVGPIDFETGYTVGNINGQNGWSKTGAYDVEVEDVGSYPDAAGYGFQTKALRTSNFFAGGAFGDQTFSPGLSQAAGEAAASHFTAGFEIGTTKAVQQPGLAISVSPDDGNGGRMSYLRFDDETDGVHVVFVDVTDAGPLGAPATFNPDVPIATLDRTHAHAIRFEIAFVDGPGTAGVGNDIVKIFVDGDLKHTGTTWENYYRYDPEQSGNNNAVPTTSKLLFAARGAPVLTLEQGQGYLIDDVALSSSTTAPVPSGPPTAPSANYDGNKTCADFDPAYKEYKIEGVPANGIHDDPNSDLVITISNSSSQTFDWASNQDISAVLVKGGAGGGGVKFAYPGANDLGDTGLHALVHDANNESPYYGISHVTFCYKVGGDTQPPVDQPVTPQPEAPTPGNPNPGNPNPNAANPNAANPSAAVQPAAEVLGVTLTQDATLPRTGGTTTQPLALAGALGLALGLSMLLLASRRTAAENH